MKLSAVLALIPLAVALPNLHIERDDTEGNLVGHHPPGVGHHPPGSGHHPPGSGHHPPGVGHHPPGSGHHPPGVGHHPQGSGIKPYYLEWHYSNNFVTVGDTNLFQAISQVGSTRGDGTGIQTDDTYKAYGADKACVYKEEYDPNLDVTVKLSGEWGVVSGIDGFTVRNQLVKSMMDLVEQIQEADGDIWKDCAQSCGPIGGCSDDPSALCGGHRPVHCACNKYNGGGGELIDLCFGNSQNMKIPSEMVLSIYNADGTLRADSLSVTVSSREISAPAMRCGKLGAVAEVVLPLIPEFGKYLSDQVKITCRV
ncbi:unnamed protein product [Zymoseptoria tritici ST99CH_3D7]|uniref:Uncharacterized protein n=1 Tax=Zymoseptoria tritici (strain ST99CH_3D7) TaxID=1276538 RepID=A0A1X7RXJ9_ZYMT9|nr:unnamed protein product [Zymoseptoria tritici ST99CH_3D7]